MLRRIWLTIARPEPRYNSAYRIHAANSAGELTKEQSVEAYRELIKYRRAWFKRKGVRDGK